MPKLAYPFLKSRVARFGAADTEGVRNSYSLKGGYNMENMLISIEEARDTLRVDGSDNDDIIIPLLESIPSYLETTTGRSWLEDDPVHPLAKTTAKFILQLWFDPQTQDSERLKRTIESLLSTLTTMGRDMNG